jgi:DNA-directed RNA polymerase subunit N (RpoN/RPB10)
MITIIRTNPENIDFIHLISELDKDIVRDGEEHSFYDQFNKTDSIKHAIVAYDCGKAVGSAFKLYKGEIAEIKRMFVHPESRGKILLQNIGRIRILGERIIILLYSETGKDIPAILYKRMVIT